MTLQAEEATLAHTNRTPFRIAVFLLLLVATVLGLAQRSQAILDGTPDAAAYPFVGAVDVGPTGRSVPGSGVLISPTVFLVAGHVAHFFADAGLTRARVTFDPVFDAANGTFHTGTVHIHPRFSGQRNDPHDIAVIVFPEPVDGVVPAQLPTANYLDRFDPGELGAQAYPAVGYGVSVLVGGRNGGGTPDIDRASAGTRRVGTWSFMSLSRDWIRFDMGDEQGCTGDSGAPNFFGDSNLIVGIGIGGDAACEAMGSDLRLDTPATRAFLAEFVILPH